MSTADLSFPVNLPSVNVLGREKCRGKKIDWTTNPLDLGAWPNSGSGASASESESETPPKPSLLQRVPWKIVSVSFLMVVGIAVLLATTLSAPSPRSNSLNELGGESTTSSPTESEFGTTTMEESKTSPPVREGSGSDGTTSPPSTSMPTSNIYLHSLLLEANELDKEVVTLEEEGEEMGDVIAKGEEVMRHKRLHIFTRALCECVSKRTADFWTSAGTRNDTASEGVLADGRLM